MTALSENSGAWAIGVRRDDEPAPAPTRAQLRREAEQAARAQRSRRALWRAWWVYPLLLGAAACVWFGVQSASAPAPREPVVVSVPGG